MKIEIVQLENIRSHTKSTVPFTKGFNCLVGGLGCGKSSVLYGIDFAFFGDPVGRSFEYLLREGSDSGKVTVQFTQSGNSYLITRGLKRRGKGISQDFEELKLFQNEKIVASTKSDAIAEQLKSITGFDRDLWREIVWVRQEHLKELIDAAPRDRQKRLDELFGLSDYETAWSNIAQYIRDYETEKKVLERDPDIANKEKLSRDYNRLTEEYTLVEIELENLREKFEIAKRIADEADKKLKQIDEKRIAIEELKRKEARIHASLSNTEENISSTAKNREGKKTLLDNLKQRQISLEAQMNACKTKLQEMGISTEQPPEMIKAVLHDFDNHVSSLRGEQEATLRNVQTDQKRLSQLSSEKENLCPLCLQPLNDEYKSSMVKRIQNENVERQETIKQLQHEIEQLQKTKNAANEAFSNLQTLSSRLEDFKLRLVEEEKNFLDLGTEIEKQQRLFTEFSKQLDSVQFEIGRFNTAEFDAAREQSRQTFRQLSNTESELLSKERHKNELLERLEEIRERIDLTQQKLERIEKIGRTLQILSAIRDAYRSIQPKLRSEFIKVLRNFVQQVLDSLVGGEASAINVLIDETYTPYAKSETGAEREVANLSGGERTLVAFSYRLGLGQLIMQSRTGHGLGILLLDEPTENLGTEDGSITRLAEAISRYRAIEQIIAVTHSEDFAEKASHVVIMEKEAGISKASIAKGE